MGPEQPRTGLALQKCQADSSPRGTRHTGLLRCLVQNARPLSFCFLLPRVQAAEVADAQMSSTSSASSSTSPAAPPLSSVSTMPLNMGKPEFADTGWGRLRDLFDKELVFFSPSIFIYLPVSYLFERGCQRRINTFWGLIFFETEEKITWQLWVMITEV